MTEPADKRNPWELLALGLFFLGAAIMWLLQEGVEYVPHYSSTGAAGRLPQGFVEMQTPALARVYGVIALVLGWICLRLYFKLRDGPPKRRK